MTKYKRYTPVDGKKPTWVIVENGKIVNYSPSKEELKGFEKEPYIDGNISGKINLIDKSEIMDENEIEKRYNDTE